MKPRIETHWNQQLYTIAELLEERHATLPDSFRSSFPQHAPAAAAAGDEADGVQNLTQVDRGFRARVADGGRNGSAHPLLVSQIRRMALGFLLKGRHPGAIRLDPHPELDHAAAATILKVSDSWYSCRKRRQVQMRCINLLK